MDTVVEQSSLTKRDLRTILSDVNSIRLAIGIGEGKLKALPQGVPGDATQCVLAKALSNGWEATVDDQVRLEHDNLESFDLSAMVATLKSEGLAAHIETDYTFDYDENDEEVETEIPTAVVINLTFEMENLIKDFDNKLLPSLILND